MRLTLKDSGKSIQLHKRDTIELLLDENPTTGYVWSVQKNNKALTLERDSYQTGTKGKGIAGAAGVHNFRFKVTDHITGDLVLSLCRPWDSEDSIDKFTVRFG